MKVLVFPKDSNPYQELLYGPMRHKVTVSYLSASINGPLRAATYVPRLILRLVRFRLRGYRLLHIHWLYPLAVPGFVPFAKRLAYIQTIVCLYSAKLLGYRLVWTAHNVLPHNQITSDDLAIRRKLSKLATAVIAHSSSTLTALAAQGIKTEHCHVIPHGNYIGVYPNTLSRRQSRQKLKLPEKAEVIVFFGTIHDYKNVPDLIVAFMSIALGNDNLYLVIAGKCDDDRVKKMINTYKNSFGDRLLLHDRYIADEDVQLYMNAADVCTFPFSEITTSGSVLLASSFGVPIVAPYIGSIKDIPKAAGDLYNPSEHDALRKALEHVLSNNKQRTVMAQASAKYAQALSWDAIAIKTLQVYSVCDAVK